MALVYKYRAYQTISDPTLHLRTTLSIYRNFKHSITYSITPTHPPTL